MRLSQVELFLLLRSPSDNHDNSGIEILPRTMADVREVLVQCDEDGLSSSSRVRLVRVIRYYRLKQRTMEKAKSSLGIRLDRARKQITFATARAHATVF